MHSASFFLEAPEMAKPFSSEEGNGLETELALHRRATDLNKIELNSGLGSTS